MGKCQNCGESLYSAQSENGGATGFACPTCGAERSKEFGEFDENENEEDFFEEAHRDVAPANSYAYIQISKLLSAVIRKFDKFDIQERDLVTLAKMRMILEDLKAYTVHGYLVFSIKQYDMLNDIDNSNLSYCEIHIDEDGLQLSKGGVIHGDFGPDSYSDYVFPFEDEFVDSNSIDVIDGFTEIFVEMLASKYSLLEIFDSGDELEEVQQD